MTYEEFLDFVPSKCMYETIYDDSNGYPTLVIRMLDAYSMVNKLQKKEWVGLTNEEIKDAWSQLWHDLNNGKFAATDDPSRHTTVMFAHVIEAKLKEKNA